jgi:hypothetical protein
MMKIVQTALLTTTLLLSLGCGDSSSNANVNGSKNKLETKSYESDTKEGLSAKDWTGLKLDLEQYYYERTGSMQSYRMKMNFSKHKVEAEANCYKVVASYNINDKALSFARLSFAPMQNQSHCVESAGAEDAIDALFSKTYTIDKLTSKEMLLHAIGEDVEVTLSR